MEQGCLTCWTVLGLRPKAWLEHRNAKHRQKHSPLNLCRKMLTIWWSQSVFSLDEETIQQICSNPDPETAPNVMVRRRRAEVKVSTLSAEQKRELVKAKDKELNTFVKYSVVEAAPRQRISPSALMKMRWVVTFKDDGSLKARLVVQGFTRIPSISSDFPDPCRIAWFSNSQKRREMCISSGRLGRAKC